MENIIATTLAGLTQGAVYSVFALGLALVYSTSRILNFAHGSMYTAAAYLAWVLSAGGLGLGFVPVLIAVSVLMFLFGVAVERVVVRPLRSRPNWKIATMITTLGLALALDNLFLVIFGGTAKSMPPAFEGVLELGGIRVPLQSLFVLAVALVTVIALQLVLSHTRLGRAMRAVSQDATGAAVVGIKANRIFAVSFGLSAVLAGIAAILLSPIYLVSPLGGWPPFLKAFVIVVFGGLGSIQGVLYAAFILGLVEAFVISELGATWTMPVWFIVLLLILMIRPRGLMGKWS
jgi:branched-chain amino acid transport system permease protein